MENAKYNGKYILWEQPLTWMEGPENIIETFDLSSKQSPVTLYNKVH